MATAATQKKSQISENEAKLRDTLTDMVCGDELVGFVKERVRDELKGARKVVVKTPSGKTKTQTDGIYHRDFATALQAVTTGQNVALIGPTGSGKTTMAQQIAEALGVEFYFNGAIHHEHKLTGFMDANSNYKPTPFYEAFVNGGVYLWDEFDASGAQAVLAFNAAMANGMMDFPNGVKKKHDQCYILASLNTWGSGRDREYVGRNKMDAASMNRLTVQLEIGYDEELERMISSDKDWAEYCISARAAIMKLGIRHIVSPRASIAGGELLAAGMSRTMVEQTVLWQGLDKADVKKVKRQMQGESSEDF